LLARPAVHQHAKRCEKARHEGNKTPIAGQFSQKTSA
jgi:hypothetical protein